MTRIAALLLAQLRSGWIRGQQVWMWGRVAALCVVVLSACRSHHGMDRNGDGVVTVLCFGDSNTAGQRKADNPKWCEFLAQMHPDWKFVDAGVNGAKAAGACFFCG